MADDEKSNNGKKKAALPLPSDWSEEKNATVPYQAEEPLPDLSSLDDEQEPTQSTEIAPQEAFISPHQPQTHDEAQGESNLACEASIDEDAPTIEMQQAPSPEDAPKPERAKPLDNDTIDTPTPPKLPTEITEPIHEKQKERALDENRVICPKCYHKQTGEHSCDRCGLVFANWSDEMARKQFTHISPQALQKANALWRLVEQAESEQSRKEALNAFNEHCMTKGARDYALSMYRKSLSLDNPDDQEIQALLGRIIMQAELLLPKRQETGMKKEVGKRGIMIAIALGLLLTTLITLVFLELLESAG